MVYIILHFFVESFQVLDREGTGEAEMNLSEVIRLDGFVIFKLTLPKQIAYHLLFPPFYVVALHDHVRLRWDRSQHKNVLQSASILNSSCNSLTFTIIMREKCH